MTETINLSKKFFTWKDAAGWMNYQLMHQSTTVREKETIELGINYIGGLYICRLVTTFTDNKQGDLDV